VAEHEEGAVGAALPSAAAAAAATAGGGGGQAGESAWQVLEREDWEALLGVYGTGALQLPR
jgi:hypothetical protein